MSIETTLARIVLAGLIGGIIGWISGSRKDVRLFSMICMNFFGDIYISLLLYPSVHELVC